MGRRKKIEMEESEVLETTEDGEQVVSKPVIDRSTLKAPINEWVETDEERYLTYEPQKCYIEFHKIFGIKSLAGYHEFTIRKDSYSNQLPVICRYVNFFIHAYDKEHELWTAYLHLKFVTDNEDGEIYFTGEAQLGQFIDHIYEVMFTPSIIRKIHQLVDDNYLDDIESDEGSKKYITKEKKHLESLEFTNEHIKTLLKISFGIKMMSPVIFHYLAKNKIIVNKTTPHLFNAFKGLFDIFSDTCNMYNKLFVYVKAKVMENKSNNDKMYAQREILGIDEFSVIHRFTRVVLISENLVKFKFNENWDENAKKYKENITGFIKTIIKYQLMYFIKEQHSKGFTELTYARNADGLSGVDKMEMQLEKLDEGSIIIAKESVTDEVERLINEYGFEITDDELDYYKKHFNIQPLHQMLITSLFAGNLGSFRNTLGISRDNFIRLALILKKRILRESGFDNTNVFTDRVALPYILTGNIKEKINTRLIRNAKFKEDCEESYIIDDLLHNKYKYLEEIDKDSIMSILSTINNTVFTYCCYENPDIYGTEINVEKNSITDELGFFLRTI